MEITIKTEHGIGDIVYCIDNYQIVRARITRIAYEGSVCSNMFTGENSGVMVSLYGEPVDEDGKSIGGCMMIGKCSSTFAGLEAFVNCNIPRI